VFVLLIVATPRVGSYVFKAKKLLPHYSKFMGEKGFIAWKKCLAFSLPHSPSSLAEWAGPMGRFLFLFCVVLSLGWA